MQARTPCTLTAEIRITPKWCLIREILRRPSADNFAHHIRQSGDRCVLAPSRMVLSDLSVQLKLCTAQRREHVHHKWPGSLLVLGGKGLRLLICETSSVAPARRFCIIFFGMGPALLDIARVKPQDPDPVGDSETEEECTTTFEGLNTFARLLVDERRGRVSMYTKLEGSDAQLRLHPKQRRVHNSFSFALDGTFRSSSTSTATVTCSGSSPDLLASVTWM